MLQSNVNISTDTSLLKWQTSLKTHHRRFYMFILSTHKSMYFHRKKFFLFIAEASIIYYHSKSFAFNIRFKIQKWILYQKLDFDKSNFAMFLFQYSDCIYAYCNMVFFHTFKFTKFYHNSNRKSCWKPAGETDTKMSSWH